MRVETPTKYNTDYDPPKFYRASASRNDVTVPFGLSKRETRHSKGVHHHLTPYDLIFDLLLLL